ncbi:MAG: hypothetical protein JRI54_14515 [Deltaproteobacteria bacterium]|nr:hypothetical protein [Deltaproteobacteria bacterium]
MARIKIKDLPADQKVSQEEMKKIMGGVLLHQDFSTTLSPMDWGGLPILGGYCRDGSSKPEDPK